MKTLLPACVLAFLLTACSFNSSTSSAASATVSYHSATLNYDPGLWTVVPDLDSLELKTDEYCWIDLTEDYTQSNDDWDYDLSTDGALTVYSLSGIIDVVSFPVGAETVEGSVGVDAPDTCMAAYRDLAEVNSK